MVPVANVPIATQIADWTPGTIVASDALGPAPAQALRDLFGDEDRVAGGDQVAPFEHWVYFRTWSPTANLGPDGHPRSGDHMPPLHDRRRMFVGGHCTVHGILRFGSDSVATSKVTRREIKSGRTGELLLVTVRTRIEQGGRLCVTEEQDLAYRSGPPLARPLHTPPQADLDVPSGRRRVTQVDPVTLFRFSALTANSHRIHYDLPYARDTEGFDGLLVHGPLLALSMLHLLDRDERAQVRAVSYRIRRPVHCGEEVVIAADKDGRRAAITGSAGDLRATAELEYRHTT